MEFDDLSERVIGCAIEVHREVPSDDEDDSTADFADERRSFGRKRGIRKRFRSPTRNTPWARLNRADFVCHDSVIVELKAIKVLTDIEPVQVLHCIKVAGLERALLINYGTPRLDYKRFIQ